MSFGSVMKKFGELALKAAPLAAEALGLPPQFAPAIASGVQIAQGMVSASNDEKAARAAMEAQLAIQQVNAIRAQHGLPPIIDETVSTDALAQAVKMTYDLTKLVHAAGNPASAPASSAG